MKLLRHPAISAFGSVTIILMIYLQPLSSSLHKGLYHMSGSLTPVIVALFAYFGAIWLVLTLLLMWSSKHPRIDAYIWLILALVLIRELIEGWFWMKPSGILQAESPLPPHWANLAFVILAFVSIVALPFLRPRFDSTLLSLKSFLMTVLAFVALSGAFSLAQVALYGWQARNLNEPRTLHERSAAATAAPKHGRVIWVVLDELSYRQAFEHRYGDLKLPAFDRLAASSTIFTDARPAGYMTEDVLPAYISGIPVDDIRTSAAGAPLWIKNGNTKQWQLYDPHNTVFQDALNDGYSTGLVGWFVPYCRIIPEVLDRCFWTNHGDFVTGLLPDRSAAWNMKQLVSSAFQNRAHQLRLTHPVSSPGINDHVVAYQQLIAASDNLLGDPSTTFLLLHMPIPHPPGIYDRDTGSFLTSRAPTYIDNLVLCDMYLAHLRQTLEANGTWDDTTLVVMGDHSWRTFLWIKTTGWTPEEATATNGGFFDDRPVYIVKLPGQTTPARIDKPFSMLRTRELFNDIFHGTITTPAQLAAWAGPAN